jgi:DNA primase
LRSPEAITQDIREVSDIVEIIGQFVTLRPAGRSLRGLCPFHQENTPSFYVHPAEQYFKCFGCSVGGDVFKFLQIYHSISFPEARQVLADRAGIPTDSASRRSPRSPRSAVLEVNRWAADRFREQLSGPAGSRAREYVASRGISKGMVEAFQLGVAPDAFSFLASAATRAGLPADVLVSAGLLKPGSDGRPYDAFRNRLIFPILDPVGQVLGFGGRTLGDDPAKYINSSETAVFSKRKVLYGLHLTREAFKRGRAILVEGYTDVIMAHQNGFAETVAALGTSLTEDHARVLQRYVPKVVLVFDGDEAGAKAAERGIDIALRCQLDVHLGILPPGQDPCDFLMARSASEFEAQLNSAPSALEFMWSRTLQEFRNGDSPSARRRAVQDFVRFVVSSEAYGGLDALQRGVVVHQLARLLAIPSEEVGRMLRATERPAAEPKKGNRGHISSGTAASGPCAARPQDAEEAGARDILIVAICEPGMYPRGSDLLRPERFADHQLRRVASEVLLLIEQWGTFSVAELLERLHDPAAAACVVNLLDEGRAAGQLGERLEVARRRLEGMATASRSRKVHEELRAGSELAPQGDDPERNRKLIELFDSVRDYAESSNFAGLRKLRLPPR